MLFYFLKSLRAASSLLYSFPFALLIFLSILLPPYPPYVYSVFPPWSCSGIPPPSTRKCAHITFTLRHGQCPPVLFTTLLFLPKVLSVTLDSIDIRLTWNLLTRLKRNEINRFKFLLRLLDTEVLIYNAT